MVSLGFEYKDGQGVKRNVDCTIQLWEIAGNAGNVTAMHMLGTGYKGMVNFPTNYWLARHWLEKAAEHGDRDSAFAVAEIYDGGQGVPPNGSLAFEWYQRVLNWPGAPKDDYTAQWATEAIAELYKWGKGVPQDDQLAVEWFQRSIDAGSISSIRELAWMYRNGRGVEKNEQVAQSLSDRYNKLMEARLTPEEKIPDCDASMLELSLSLHRNVNSGDIEGIVELRNVSDRTCRVEGASLNFTSPTVCENFPVKTCQNSPQTAGTPRAAT